MKVPGGIRTNSMFGFRTTGVGVVIGRATGVGVGVGVDDGDAEGWLTVEGLGGIRRGVDRGFGIGVGPGLPAPCPLTSVGALLTNNATQKIITTITKAVV